MKVLHLAPLALLVVACASSQQAAPAPAAPAVAVVVAPPPAPKLTPEGSYEFSTVVDGNAVTGTMEIASDLAGGYKGKILTNVFPEIPIVGAVVDGDAINVRANMPDGELSIHMVFLGTPEFKGNWALGGATGDFNGKKLK